MKNLMKITSLTVAGLLFVSTTQLMAQQASTLGDLLNLVEGDRIAELRLVLGSVAPVPWRCRGAEALAVGRRNDAETWAAVAEAALEGAEPLSENGYKVPLTKGLIEKAMRRLALEDA